MRRVIVFHASTKGMVKQFDVCHYGGGRGRQGGKTARIRGWTSVLSNSEHMFSAGSSEKWQMKTYKKANNVSRTIQYV